MNSPNHDANIMRLDISGSVMQHSIRDQRTTTTIFCISILLNLPQVILSIGALILYGNDQCDRPLPYWLLIFGIRLFLATLINVNMYRLAVSPRPIETKIYDKLAFVLQYVLDMLGILWFISGSLWAFGSTDCADKSPQLYHLIVGLILFNAAVLLLPCILLAVFIPIAVIFLPRVLQRNANVNIASRDNNDPATIQLRRERINALDCITYHRNNIDENESISSLSQTACAVCLDDYDDGDFLRIMPHCNHTFHKCCVDAWLVSNPTCPTCRRSVLDRRSSS